MKQVLFISSGPLNPDPRAEKQIKSLLNNGYSVSAIGWDREKKSTSDIIVGGVPISLIKVKSSFGNGIRTLFPMMLFEIILTFKLIFRWRHYDIIHCINLDTALIGVIIAKIFKKKVVYDIYDYYVDAFSVPKKIKKFIRWIDKKVIEKSDVVILPLESRIDQIYPACPKKVIYVYNTPRDERIIKRIDNKKLSISYVGVLQEERYLKEILKIVDDNSDLELNIAGFGKENIINQIKKTKNCHFFGKVSYEKGLEISAQSDILICVYNPTNENHKYSAPNKFYEAMMLGKPIIVAKGMGIDKFVKENFTGFVIDYNNPLSLESLLSELIREKKELEKIGRNARICYDKYFSWDLMEERLIGAYEKL